MTKPFNLWSSISDVFVTGTGALDGEDWSSGNVTDGGSPIWVDNWTPASAYSTTVASTYTIELTSEDWVGSVQPMITVATTTFINPFSPQTPGGGNLAAAMIFTSNSTVGNGGVVYWTASTATPGDYDVDFQALTTNYVSAPSTGPNTTLTGSPTTLISAVAAPTSWNVNWGSSDFVFAYTTAASATTKNIWLEGFSSAGVAESADVEAFTGVSDSTQYYVGYNSTSDTYDLDYTLVNGSATGWYNESFDPTTGVLGAPTLQLSLDKYSTFFGISSRILSDDSHIRVVSGTIGSQQVLQLFHGTKLKDTIDLAGASADHWSDAGIYDPNTGNADYTALVYSENEKVFIDLFNASGVEIGGPERLSGLTSFDRIHEMGHGSRVEIDYTYTDSAGGDQIGAVIYDAAPAGYVNTLTTGGGEYVGTPFQDVYKVTSSTTGDYFISGGGGADKLRVAADGDAVQFTTGAEGFPEVVTSGATVTLEGFATVKLNDETIKLAGTASAPEIEVSVGGELQLESSLPTDYTIAFAKGGGQVTLGADSSLGASLATWRKGDSAVFNAVDYVSTDSLLFVPNSGSGGVLELLNASDVDVANLFKVTGGALTTSDFSLKNKGTFAEVAFV